MQLLFLVVKMLKQTYDRVLDAVTSQAKYGVSFQCLKP